MSLYALIRPFRSVAFVGMCKNAGKTTALNRAITDSADDGTLGLTSIGRDGEQRDLVTGTKKPSIYVREGTYVATAAGLLGNCDITREIVDMSGIPTPLGEVAILRALSDGYVEIAGPSIVALMARLSERFFALGCRRVFLDGAISRKSLAAPSVSEAVVLSTGASYASDLDFIVEDTVKAAELLLLPASTAFSSVPSDQITLLLRGESVDFPRETGLLDALKTMPDCRHAYWHGALTDAIIQPLVSSSIKKLDLELSVEDGSRVLVSPAALDKLQRRGVRLAAVRTTTLAAVTVNPFSAYGMHQDGRLLLDRLRARLPVPVIDVREE